MTSNSDACTNISRNILLKSHGWEDVTWFLHLMWLSPMYEMQEFRDRVPVNEIIDRTQWIKSHYKLVPSVD